MLDELEDILIDHEGLKHHAYLDSLNNCTVGIGRNIGPNGPGLSTEECVYLLRNDINRISQHLERYDWYRHADQVRRECIIELAFNMGVDGLLTFNKMIDSFSRKDYKSASDELLDSKWATQVSKSRSDNISKRIITGSY